jgi:hypothetical protein
VFTAPLPAIDIIGDTVSSIAACLIVAADKCLPRRCLTMAASIQFTIPAFSRYVIVRYDMGLKEKVWYIENKCNLVIYYI